METPVTFKDIRIVWDDLAKAEPPSFILMGPAVARYAYKLWAPWKRWVITKGRQGEKPPRGWMMARQKCIDLDWEPPELIS